MRKLDSFLFISLIFWSFLVPGCRIKQIGTKKHAPSTLAFPGAEGFGRKTTGGRGGSILIVDNLNDDGEGSLRWAVDQTGPRFIIFKVSGTISLNSSIVIKHDSITIAGHSAPGDGICVKNFPLSIQANNVIIRYMRFRLGDESRLQDDALKGTNHQNIIIDHCSISWAIDECASFYNNINFTLQWSIISESLNHSSHEKGRHGYGGIWGGYGASFHHNLLAHHSSRTPRFYGSRTGNSKIELVDFRNNVIYNWMDNSSYGGEKGNYNIVNNYYKTGPATKINRKTTLLEPFEPYGSFYISGNYFDGSPAVSANNWKGVVGKNKFVAQSLNPFEFAEVQTHTPEVAYDLVLDAAGASHERDSIDKRIIDEVRRGIAHYGKNQTGIIDSQEDVGGWVQLTTRPYPDDSDNDGIPDEWEIRNKLDPNNFEDASTVRKSNNGYSNIEMYLNQLIQLPPNH